jgi:hypothetical protein
MSSPMTGFSPQSQRIGSYVTGKMVSVAIAIAFLLAIAVGVYLHAHLRIDTLAGLGFSLMVWAIATFAFVVIGVCLAL